MRRAHGIHVVAREKTEQQSTPSRTARCTAREEKTEEKKRGHGGNAARQFEVMTKSSNGWGKLGLAGLHSTASCRRSSSHTSYYNAAALWLYRRPEMGYQAAFRHRAGERRHAPAVFGADTSLNIGATVPARGAG
jgi:hypothetical protein